VGLETDTNNGDRKVYSVIVNKEVLDFSYKKTVNDFYAFRIGDILIGTISNTPSGWAAISHMPQENGMGLVYGFKTRLSASEYLLKLQGYQQ